jgi:hypothetical protein
MQHQVACMLLYGSISRPSRAGTEGTKQPLLSEQFFEPPVEVRD